MIAREMIEREVSVRDIATKLGVDESTLRYRLKRPADEPDGRRDRGTALDGWDAVVTAVLERFGDARVLAGGTTRCQARMVFDVLVREFGFGGSYQAVRRYLHRTYGPPAVQAVRRVETPAGVQAQHDWFEWEGFEVALGSQSRRRNRGVGPEHVHQIVEHEVGDREAILDRLDA